VNDLILRLTKLSHRKTPALLGILGAFLALTAGLAQNLSAQLAGQSFEVTSDTSPASVGDTVTLRFRIRLHERDQPLDSVPQVVGDLPPGVRVFSIAKLTKSETRLYEGTAQVAFYRPGRRAVPTFGLPFMRIVEGVSRANLPSDSAFVDIRPVLPAAGNPPLKDIRELEHKPASAVPWVVLAGVLAAGVYVWSRRRRTPKPEPIQPPPEPEPAAPDPYAVAVMTLNRIEAEHWPSRGKVEQHYEAVANTLRQYLEDGHGLGALERTTSELLWAIPPHLSRAGLRDQCLDVLGEADLVKFAEIRPSPATAGDFLERARHLLAAWHEVSGREDMVDAPR
jgi:hypothetical protein